MDVLFTFSVKRCSVLILSNNLFRNVSIFVSSHAKYSSGAGLAEKSMGDVLRSTQIANAQWSENSLTGIISKSFIIMKKLYSNKKIIDSAHAILVHKGKLPYILIAM